ncbi:hypothetical protein TNCV_2084491 [Trichonephila clavipes]|uniref:Uncharacterized protein n=1 Tax=Trichonephila clavipes TaxID=2585209 RepID=A0A8X6RNJ9_TRICX|nr:hypothetical protein TNCV_2084491 [Trichonephila clavipes]
MDTFSSTMIPVIQLELSPNSSNNITETLPYLVGLHNHHISIQLKICGMRPNGASGSWFQYHPIRRHWKVQFTEYRLKFLIPPTNYS